MQLSFWLLIINCIGRAIAFNQLNTVTCRIKSDWCMFFTRLIVLTLFGGGPYIYSFYHLWCFDLPWCFIDSDDVSDRMNKTQGIKVNSFS